MVQAILSTADFDRLLDSYAGRQVSHTPITKTTSNISGQETLTDGTPVTLKAYFVKTSSKVEFENAGLTITGQALLLAKVADGVSRDDKIIADGETYRVRETYDVNGTYDSTGSGTAAVYTACSLWQLS